MGVQIDLFRLEMQISRVGKGYNIERVLKKAIFLNVVVLPWSDGS